MNNLERCLAYLSKLPPALSGSGGHNATLRAACECVRFGLTDSECMQALGDFNQRCQPPWSERELAHKLADARKLSGAQPRTRKAQRSGRAMARTFDHGALDRALAARGASRPVTPPGAQTPIKSAFQTSTPVLAPLAPPLAYTRDTARAMQSALEAVEQLPGYEHALPIVCQAVEFEEYYWALVWRSIGRPDPGLDPTQSPIEEHTA